MIPAYPIRFRVLPSFCFLLIFFLVSIETLYSQKSFRRLKPGLPEIRWAVFHPFSARNAFRITERVVNVTDSIRDTGMVGKDSHGGELDAFRHAYWMAILSLNIGWRKSRSLGNAHEKSNYRSFKKARRKGKPDKHDAAAREMDLWNNNAGMATAKGYPDTKHTEMIDLIVEAIRDGKMKVILKNKVGQSLDSSGRIIPEPFAIPVKFSCCPSSSNVTENSFATVSVVMIASDAERHSCASRSLFKALVQAVIFS